MCKLPRVVVIAPEARHLELRKTLSSLEYEVTATVTSASDVPTADVVISVGATDTDTLRSAGAKVVVVGDDGADADMHLDADDIAAFKTRIWEMFRPA